MDFVPADLVVNRSVLKDGIGSWKDLLKPEYRGKIATFEPRSGGQGQQHAAYLLNLFGADFIKNLYVGQKVVYTGDRRQLGDWVARGTYPIVMAIATREVEEARRLGIPIERVFPEDGPGVLVGASGVIKLVRNAPHPNGASVFLNWFLTREAQEIFQRTNAMLSRRTDVDMSGIPDYIIPKQGVRYEDFYTYPATVEFFPKARKMLEQLLGGR
jgi:iron(III) transport system substrate-binding protein